ncbi:MAG: PolC-type DNA polymerase III [Clostridiales bacterium]|nr:PolC-type DNA polymerase III [Clostridiales bacterium]
MKVPFYDVFPELLGLSAPFNDALVCSIVVDKSRTGVDITAELKAPLPPADLLKAEAAICEHLGLSRARLQAVASEKITAAAHGPPSTPPAPEKVSGAAKKQAVRKAPKGRAILGRMPSGSVTAMSEIDISLGQVTVAGEVFAVNSRPVRGGAWVLSFDMTDNTSSIRISKFVREAEAKNVAVQIKTGMHLRVSGKLFLDRYEGNDIALDPTNIAAVRAPEKRRDDAPEKRVELHLHTKMSAMDAITDTGQAIKRAIEWGHPAIAITDHGVAHSFPDAHLAAGDKIRVLYGIEGYYINDIDARPGVYGDFKGGTGGEFVAFDIETTGLSSNRDRITEIAAVAVRNGEILSEFQTYANPGMKIPAQITSLTGITDETVRGAPSQIEAVRAFLEFADGRTLCAHNASFDLGFIAERCENHGVEFSPACLDTLELSRALMPDILNHKLPTVADALGLPQFSHHRALDDARTTALIMAKLCDMLQARGISGRDAINTFVAQAPSKSRRRPSHIIIFARTQAGLKNLYKLITKSHLEHLNRFPIILKSLLAEHRDGLLIGSACESGEIWNAVERSSRFEQRRLAEFYDYLEIQPLSNNLFMLRGDRPRAAGEEQLREWNRRIVELGREVGKPVVATGDVHFLDPEDEVYRRILLCSKDFPDVHEPLPLHMRTTEEMLCEFKYLGEETAYEVVVTNTRKIADMFENVRPLPPEKQLFAPKIENSSEELKSLVFTRLRELYGENPPEIIAKRVDTELNDILSRGYDVIYITAQRLVKRSLDSGYLVGSRGSVGSSVVAYLSGITEVNALPAHYRCPHCKNTDFDSGLGCGCGADMPDGSCPVCGTAYIKDGFNIPFETFLGFGGDKVPDIDLNFSGEYQAEAHRHTIEMFGEKNVYRAGTIGTIKDRMAYGHVKHYLEVLGKTVPRAEENRLVQGCIGVKKTTGQHPGGLIVIPRGMDITDFCPAQFPADDRESGIITTHFDYHCMEDNLLKLDELGHDDPTMIKMMEDLTGVDATEIPLDDPDTMRIFTTPEPLGIRPDDSIIGGTGTIGIPEFGTGFTRQMLCDTLPKSFDTLVRLSGYSHGTGVWLGNAKDIILNNVADISDTIGCRDDIMLYLISVGMDERRAFKISENIRKGRGLPDGAEDEMIGLGVPEWYIKSCKTIEYLFPKAHAVAYVMMAFRIAWFKVHHPLPFYSAYFYRRSQKDRFDADIMTRGDADVKKHLRAIGAMPEKDRKGKDEGIFTTLEACHEFYLRGFKFLNVDIYKSDPVKFTIEGENTLRPPLIGVAGLGEIAAYDIEEQRLGREFISVEEFAAACRKVSSANIEALQSAGAFGAMPETSQLSLF